MNQPNSNGNLPFGFSGESNVQVSRLPFGIGSHADGIPFENQPTIQENVNTSNDNPLHNEPSDITFGQNDITSFEETEINELEDSSEAMVRSCNPTASNAKDSTTC